jgi:hypothetical protein
MPFALDSNPSNIELSDAINYLLGNFGANLSADPNTGLITGPTGQTIAYLYKYLSVRYADSPDGSLNFSNSPTNRQYYGIRNNNDPTESTNPADYIWQRVAGGFGTTKFLFYKVSGGRQIEFFVDTIAPGYAWQQDSGAAIDLDAISVVITATPAIYQWTATSTPPARPTTTTTYTWATGSYTAPAGWAIEVPSNTTPGAYLWEISITIVQTGGIDTEVLDWTDPAYAIRAVGRNGETGATGNSALTAYRAQDQASATPTFTTPTSGPNAPSGWSLGTPSVAVGQVLWYIQGEYNGSATVTINGVAPNTTRWTGPIAASVFQDIRSDNWNGSNPPSFGSPGTWGTDGYYISRSTGTAILNNLGARGTIQSGSSPAISGSTMTGAGAVINSSGTFAVGDSTNNITYNGSTITMNGNIVAVGNLRVGTTTTQDGNTFGFGTGTAVAGILTTGFFQTTRSDTAALAAMSSQNIAFAGTTVANTIAGGFGNRNPFAINDLASGNNITLANFAHPLYAGFIQRRTQGGNASYVAPDANTKGYVKLAFNESGIDYALQAVYGPTAYYALLGTPFYALYTSGPVGPFTGSHDGVMDKSLSPTPGDILVDLDVVAKKGVSDTVTFVEPSSSASQANVIGVFVGLSDQIPTAMSLTVEETVPGIDGPIITKVEILNPIYDVLMETNNYVIINSVGEGQINVCGLGGNIQKGDLICSSTMSGKGMKQTDDIVRSKTVAKSRENVTFSSPTDVQQIACIYLCG